MRHMLLSGIVRNSQKVKDCIALALLGIHLNSVCSQPVVAILRSKVSMRISVEQHRSRIGFHTYFVNALINALLL